MTAPAFTVQLRDSSPSARAELEALVRRYNGEPSGAGDQLTVRPVFHVLEADPARVGARD